MKFKNDNYKATRVLQGCKYFSDWDRKQVLFVSALVVFIVMATVISSSFSRDSYNYTRMFEFYGASGWALLPAEILRREAFFIVLSKLLYSLGVNSVFLFAIFASVSLTIKFVLIDRYSKDRWLSLAFFASYFFILHDSTQIRFGMAIAFAYLGLSFLANNQKLLFVLIVLLSAILFHVSCLIFIIMLFLTSRQSLAWLLALIILAVLTYFIDLRAFLIEAVVPVINNLETESIIKQKMHNYLELHNVDVRFGLFNWRVLPVYMSAIVLFRYRSAFSRYELLCYKSLLVSILFYIMLKDLTEIQYRLSGLFGFSFVFLVPYIHKWLSEKSSEKASYVLLISFFLAYLLKFAFYDKMIVI